MDNNSNMLQLCRLCLVKDDVNIPIFEEQGDIRQIFLKISSCLPVKVSRDDRLPKKICDGCSYKLDMLYEFWNTSANAEKQLLTWLGEAGMTSQMADGTISAVAQQIKPADTFVKQETVDPPDIHSDDDDKDYVYKDKDKQEEKSKNNVDEPPPKRARRTAAVKAAIAMDQDSDDDDSGEPMTKIEDDSDDSDNDDHEPAFVDVPSTSADDQPGPSGVGKDGVEAPLNNDNANSEITDCSILIEDDEVDDDEIEDAVENSDDVYYDEDVIPVGGLEEISQSDIIETTVFVEEGSNDASPQQLVYPDQSEPIDAYGLEQDPLAVHTTSADVITIDDDPPENAAPKISVAKNLANTPMTNINSLENTSEIQNDSIIYKEVFKCRSCSNFFDSAATFMAHQYLAKKKLIPGHDCITNNAVSTNTPTVPELIAPRPVASKHHILKPVKNVKIPSSLDESQQPQFIFVPHVQNTPGVNLNDLVFLPPQSSTVSKGSSYISGLSPTEQVFGSAKVLPTQNVPSGNTPQYFPDLVPFSYKPQDMLLTGPLPTDHSGGVLYMNGNQVIILPTTQPISANTEDPVDKSFAYMPSIESATTETVPISNPSKITPPNLSHYQAEFVSRYLPQNVTKTLTEQLAKQVNPELASANSLLKSQIDNSKSIFKKKLSRNKKIASNIVINGITYKLMGKSVPTKSRKRVPAKTKVVPSVTPQNTKPSNDVTSNHTGKGRKLFDYSVETEKSKKSVVVRQLTPVVTQITAAASNVTLDSSIAQDIQMPKITNVMSVEGEQTQSDSITIISDDDSNTIANLAFDNILSQSSDDIESALPMSLIVREEHANDVIDLG